MAAGTPVESRVGRTLQVTNSSASDNDVLYDLDARSVESVTFGSGAGAVDVFGSVDGVNFLTSALAMEDLTATAPATRVVVTTANKPAMIRAPFSKLRFMQNGATGVTGFGLVAKYKDNP